MIDVFLPIDQTIHDHIDRASGIVGTPEGDRVVIDFEGNRFGASNIVTFADRVMIAAGRHESRYPTIARLSVEPASVVRVGTYDGSRKIAVDFDKLDALAAWIGCDVASLPTQLSVTR